MTAAPMVENEFRQLRITYRKTDLPNGVLYFCTAADGHTFDTFLEVGERLRLCRFICECPAEKAGSRLELRVPGHPRASFAFEIDEGGELFFCAELALEPGDPRSGEELQRLIRACAEADTRPEDLLPWLTGPDGG